MADSPNPRIASPPQAASMRRRLLRIFFLVLALLVLGAVAVQIVLSTNIPRNLVLRGLQQSLGLLVDADSLSTGWFGRTTLQNVTISLPLAGESLLTVKTLHVRHSSLPAILLGRPVKLESLEFDEPQLLVQQDSTGRWNVADMIDLLRHAAGGQQAAESAQANRPDRLELPQIILHDGTIRIVDRNARTATLQPVNLIGQPEGPLVWRYDAAMGPADRKQINLVGKLAPGGDWQHEVSIALADVDRLVQPWLAGASPALGDFIHRSALKGQWRGQVVNGSVEGLLDLTDFHSGPTVAQGAIHVQFKAGVLTAQPTSLLLAGVPKSPSNISLKSGAVVLEGSAVRTESLIATAAGGDVRVTGRYDWGIQSGDLHADWHHLLIPNDFAQSGSLEVHARNNFPGIRQVEAQVVSQAISPKYRWDAAVKLNGTGKTFAAVRWEIAAEKLRLTQGSFTTNLDGLAAKFTQLPDRVSLSEISVPPGALAPGRPRGSIRGNGFYQFPDPASHKGGDWWILLSGEDWRLSDAATTKTRFALDISGDLHAPDKGDWARIEDFYATTDKGMQVSASGRISYMATGMPAELWIYSWYPPFTLDAYDAGVLMQAGQFISKLHLSGGAWPLRLDLAGDLLGHDVYVRGRKLGDVVLILKGSADAPPNGDPLDYVIKLNTEKLHVFDGIWNIRAGYSNANRRTDLNVDLESLSLAKLDNFIAPPPRLRGELSGSWALQAPNFHFSEMKVESNGPWKISDFASGPFSAGQITGEIHVADGNVGIDRVVARNPGGGQITAAATFRLKNPSQMKVSTAARAWPVQLPGVSLVASGRTDEPIAIDFHAKTFFGSFHLDAQPAIQGKAAGIIHTQGNIHGRTLSLTRIDGENFGGELAGTAGYDFDQPTSARVDLNLEQVDTAQLVAMFPQATGLTGRFSGSVLLGPPKNPRPIAPLQLHLQLTGTNAKWRSIDLKRADLTGYYDRDPASREARFVIDHSDLTVSDGDVRVFARASKHPLDSISGGDDAVWSFNAELSGQNLDLNQLVHAGDPKAHDMPGRLQFKVNLLGNPRDVRRIVGEGSAVLTDTDLADNTIISALYGLLSIKLGPKVPTGRGKAAFRLEGTNLDITEFSYFNRGFEALGTGRIEDVWKAGDAGLGGFVIGSVRPLKDLKLPFIADIDKIFVVVQRNATPVRVSGTVKDPKVASALFGDIGQALRALILGDVKGE